MESKDFKSLFDEISKSYDFKAAHGGWYRELPVALLALNLQKSNHGNYFELNIKIFLIKEGDEDPMDIKKCIKNMAGDIFRRQPEETRPAFDLDASIGNDERRILIDGLFKSLISRISDACSSPAHLLKLRDEGILFLLPMVAARLAR